MTTASSSIDGFQVPGARYDAPPPPPTRSDGADIGVEFWGPPGSGKTLLLVSLYQTLLNLGELNEDKGTAEFHKIRRRVIKGQGTPITLANVDRKADNMEGETLTLPIRVADGTYRRIAIRAHAGEDLNYQGAIDVPRFISERRDKVFVACLNPFRVDQDLAWKGLQHMIAVLQSERIGLPLQEAVEQAVWTLFQMSPDETRKLEPLRSYLNQFNAKLNYDPTRTESEEAFYWNTAHQQTVERIAAQLKALISTSIDEQAPLLNTVRQALKHLPHSMVVLTHIDIIDALLPSITFSDIERVFENLFLHRPERMVNQQALARPYDVEITGGFDHGMTRMGGNTAAVAAPPPAVSAGPLGVPPLGPDGGLGPNGGGVPPLGPDGQFAAAVPTLQQPGLGPPGAMEPGVYAPKGMITGRLRKKGAIALVSYLKAVASFGRVDTNLNWTVSHLQQQINNLTGELQASRNNEAQRLGELQKATARGDELARQLQQALAEKAKVESDYGQALTHIGQRDTTIDGLRAELEETRKRRDGLQLELANEQAARQKLEHRLAELGSVDERLRQLDQSLAKEREGHADTRRQHDQKRQDLARVEHERDELRGRLDLGDGELRRLEQELEYWKGQSGGQEAENLRKQVRELGVSGRELREQLEDAERERQSLAERLDAETAKATTSEAERTRLNDLALAWQRKAEEIRAQAQAAIAQRDRAITDLRQEVATVKAQLGEAAERLAEAQKGTLPPHEKHARDDYEDGRMAPAKWWALLTLRALPVMPLIAWLVFLLVWFVVPNGPTGPMFFVCSVSALVVSGLALLTGLLTQWHQFGPRWIWLRSMNTRTRTFETLTSSGERVTAAPEGFVLEKSPLLSLLGLGVIRRADTGQKYMTTEPDAWLNAPEPPAVRAVFGWDILTLVIVLAWLGLTIGLAVTK